MDLNSIKVNNEQVAKIDYESKENSTALTTSGEVYDKTVYGLFNAFEFVYDSPSLRSLDDTLEEAILNISIEIYDETQIPEVVRVHIINRDPEYAGGDSALNLVELYYIDSETDQSSPLFCRSSYTWETETGISDRIINLNNYGKLHLTIDWDKVNKGWSTAHHDQYIHPTIAYYYNKLHLKQVNRYIENVQYPITVKDKLNFVHN